MPENKKSRVSRSVFADVVRNKQQFKNRPPAKSNVKAGLEYLGPEYSRSTQPRGAPRMGGGPRGGGGGAGGGGVKFLMPRLTRLK